MASPPAHVTPRALRWARESSGFDLETAAARIGVSTQKLEAAERGEDFLTLRQAEAAARRYERPLAALFVPEPPPEETPENQFRRLPGAPPLPWPQEMKALAKRIRGRQAAALELYALLDEEPPWSFSRIEFSEDTEVLAAFTREQLKVPLSEQKEWRDPSGYQPLRAWVDAVEGLGVLVMQDGSLPLEEMRGFASAHDDVPAIVVNTTDDPRARAFTVVHELGHLLRTGANRPTGTMTERWCNEFASALLMPRAEFEADFHRHRGGQLVQTVERVALLYGVTPLAASVRAARLGLAQADAIEAAIEAIQKRPLRREDEEGKGGGGGNYYLTTVGRLGPTFIQLVFSALDTQVLSYPAAAGVLGVKVNNFGKLRDRAHERGR